MRAIKSIDTGPEIQVRRILFALGFRYRLHRRDLPGCPDIAIKNRKRAIFVNGCFWHGHDCPRGRRVPKRNNAYWRQKIGRNVARDAWAIAKLKRMRWRVLTVWECELKGKGIANRLRRFMT